MHFQVKLAIPAIAGQPGLSRRSRPATLHGGEILGEDNSPLQFGSPQVAAAGQLHRPARLPETVPMRGTRGKHGGGSGQRRGECLRRKGQHGTQLVRTRLRLKVKHMRITGCEPGAIPFQPHKVTTVI